MSEPTPPSSSSQTAPRTPPIRLLLWHTVMEAQTKHGVGVGDYAQYHAYGTHALARLRHNRAVASTLVHSHTYGAAAAAAASTSTRSSHGTRGPTDASTTTTKGHTHHHHPPTTAKQRRHAYCPRDPDVPITHVNQLLVTLFQAERAWAQAMGTTPRHAQKRLRKAVAHATRLRDQCQTLEDSVLVAEATAYAATLHGHAAVHQRRYRAAAEAYTQATRILREELVGHGTTRTDQSTDHEDHTATMGDLQVADVWVHVADTVIRPLLRYCQYECHQDKDTGDTHAAALDGGRTNPTGTTTQPKGRHPHNNIVVDFCGHEIGLDAFQSIAVLYLKMEPSLSSTTTTTTTTAQTLSDLDDARRLVRTELDRYRAAGTGPAVTAAVQQLERFEAYVQYHTRAVWMRQQEDRPSDDPSTALLDLHTYDSLHQNALAMVDLVEPDSTEHLESSAHVLRLRALRCFALSTTTTTTTTTMTGVGPAVALLGHSLKLCRRAAEEVAACDFDTAQRYQNQMEALARQIRATQCRWAAWSYLVQSTTNTTTYAPPALPVPASTRPLWMRLDDMDASTVLTLDPLEPIPVPCKGVFYDMAWEHDVVAPLDELEAFVARHEPANAAGGGLWSWFSSKR